MIRGVPVGAHRQIGVSLVEMLMALAIGLLIVMGGSRMFMASRDAFDRLETLAERQESLRFIAEVISQDVRTARGLASEGPRRIALSYGSLRADDPYCTATSSGVLETVRYEFADDGTLYVSHRCAGDAGFSSAQGLVSHGVEELTFTLAENHVVVSVAFSPVEDEAEAGRRFVFRAAAREAILLGRAMAAEGR